MSHNVLILGATGQIGHQVVEQLSGDHADGKLRLHVSSRQAEAREKFARAGFGIRNADLDAAEREGLFPLIEAFGGMDSLFLVSGYDVRMLAQSKAAIDAAVKAGVRHVVHIGAHAAEDTTIIHLGWHRLVETYLAASGLSFTNLRPTSFMQNLMLLRVVGGASAGVLPHYIGNAATSWIDTFDIAAVAAAVLRAPASHIGKSYSLGAESATMAEIAALLSDITGRAWRAEARDPVEFLRAVTKAGADPLYMACVTTIFRRTAEGTLPDLNETFNTIETVAGRPRTSLREFLKRNERAFA